MDQISVLCQRFELTLNQLVLHSRSAPQQAWAFRNQLVAENDTFIEKVANAAGYATTGPGKWRDQFLREGVSTRLSKIDQASFVRLQSRALSVTKELTIRAEAHLSILCKAYEDTLSDGQMELTNSQGDESPEQVWIRYDRFTAATNAFLDNFGIAVDSANRRALSNRSKLWKGGAPKQFSPQLRTRVPELGKRASDIKGSLEERARELIPDYVDSLYARCRSELTQMQQSLATDDQPSLKSLQRLQELERDVDATVDTFLEPLGKALHYTTEGYKPEWQAHVLQTAVPRYIPDRHKQILELKASVASIKNDIHARAQELLQQYAATLVETCERRLTDVQQKLAAIQESPIEPIDTLLELRQLGDEVAASIDTLFEELAKVLQYKTVGFKSSWQSTLLGGVSKRIPGQEQKIRNLKTTAASVKDLLDERLKESLHLHVDTLRHAYQARLHDVSPDLTGIHQLRQFESELDSTVNELVSVLNRMASAPSWRSWLLDEGVSDIKDQIQGHRTALLRSHVDSLCDTCRRGLDSIRQKTSVEITQPSLTGLQQLDQLESEIDTTIDTFLEGVAEALNYKNEGSKKSSWQGHVLRTAVPNHLPDRKEKILQLKADASVGKAELQVYRVELLRPYVAALSATCQQRLEDIREVFAAIRQPTLANLVQVRQLDSELDATIDNFLEDLANAVNRATTGRNKFVWQSHLLADVPTLLPDNWESVLQLKADISWTKDQLHERLTELLHPYVDARCDICQRELEDIQHRLDTPRLASSIRQRELQQLSSDVDLTIDSFLEDIGRALNRSTEGTRRTWQGNLLRDAVPRSLPDHQERILGLKAYATSLKNGLSAVVQSSIPDERKQILRVEAGVASTEGDGHARPSELLRSRVDSLSDTCQRRLDSIRQKLVLQQQALASLRQLDSELEGAIDTFLEDLAEALAHSTIGPKEQWQRSLLEDKVPGDIPDRHDQILELKSSVVSVKNIIDARTQELLQLQLHIVSLIETCDLRLSDIKGKATAIQGTSPEVMDALMQMHQLATDVDTSMDTLFADLAAAFQYKTVGLKSEWQSNVLFGVSIRFTDQEQKILNLKAAAASIKDLLEERSVALLRSHVDTLCDSCQRELQDVRHRLLDALPDLAGLRQIETKLETVIDTFLEDLATALHHPTGEPKEQWHRSLLEETLRSDIPDRQQKISQLNAEASEIKNILSAKTAALPIGEHEKHRPRAESPERSTTPGTRQAPLTTVAHSARARCAGISRAPATAGSETREVLLQGNQLQRSAPRKVSELTDEWKTLDKQLDIFAEIIASIDADLRPAVSDRPNSRVAEEPGVPSDSQTLSHIELLQWIAAMFNGTKDAFKLAEANFYASRKKNSGGLRETRKKIDETEQQFRGVIGLVSAVRSSDPKCSQRTFGALMWAETELKRLKRGENEAPGRNAIRRRQS